MPNIERYQSDILARLSTASAMKVTADKLQGGWQGFRPTLTLSNVVFAPPAVTFKPVDIGSDQPAASVTPDAQALLKQDALRIPTLRAGLSWWSLLMGQPRFSNLQIVSPALTLTRTKDGLIYFAGKAVNKPSAETDDDRFVTMLLDQPGAEVSNASLTWNDLQNEKAATFTNVNLKIEKISGRHKIAFTAKPPAPLASLLEARADLQLSPPRTAKNNWLLQGKVFAQLGDIYLDEVKQYVALPDHLKTGRGWILIPSPSLLCSTVMQFHASRPI